MGLETGDYFSDLNPAWPLGTDGKNQGDDHLRLIKRVLRAFMTDDSPNTLRRMLIGGVPMFQFSTTGFYQLDGQANTVRSILYANSSTWTKQLYLQFALWVVQGSGGAGGGAQTTVASQGSAGGGGGGGVFMFNMFRAADLPASVSITIGSGGAPAAGAAGGSGGQTNAVGVMTASGASGGGVGPAGSATTGTLGGLGGLAQVGGLVNNYRGQQGGWSLSAAGVAFGGDGGSSNFGQGGRGGVGDAPGDAAVGFGGGGGGARNAANVAGGRGGGPGTAGFVYVLEIY